MASSRTWSTAAPATPHANLAISKMQILIGHGMAELSATHWLSEHNADSDKLSRMAEGPSCPSDSSTHHV